MILLTTKTIANKLWLYEKSFGSTNAKSIGKAQEVLEMVALMELRNWRDKRVLVNLLLIQGKDNMATFFEQTPSRIRKLLEVIDFEKKLGDIT